MTKTRDEVLKEVLDLLASMARDWEYEGAIGPDTRLFGDLAFESLDVVVLGTAVQEHFGQTFPFPQLFAEVGQRSVRDMTLGEWADFIHRHLQQPAQTPASRGA